MYIIRVIKALVAFCILAVIFGMESYLVHGYDIRLPDSLQNSSLTKEQIRWRVNAVDDSRIIGGKPAVHGEFPYQASLQKLSLLGLKIHFCGGAIASPSCIVTAAHCLQGRGENEISVRIGSASLRHDHSAREFYSDKLVVHPEYNPHTIQHDIGVIMLKTPLSFRVNINRVPLPEFEAEVNETSECLISGWGSAKEGGSTSRSLMYATVPVISDEKCREFYGKNEILETNLCAGFRQGGTDSCQGDSGGPLVCNGELAGIVSWGVGCARPNYPGVYTQVSHYSKWIESLGCFDHVQNDPEQLQPAPNRHIFPFHFIWPKRHWF